MSEVFLGKEFKFLLKCICKKGKSGKELLNDVDGNEKWKIWDEQKEYIMFITKEKMLKEDLKIPKKLENHPDIICVYLLICCF